MAKNDIKIVDLGGNATMPTYKWQTEAAQTAIYAGEPVKLKSAGSPYVIPWADRDITPGTDTMFIGIAASDSTQTAAADGYVMVYIPNPTYIYEAAALTPGNVNTQAKINAMCGDRKSIDLTSSTYTLDDTEADSVTYPLLVVGGDPVRKTLRFMIRSYVNTIDGA